MVTRLLRRSGLALVVVFGLSLVGGTASAVGRENVDPSLTVAVNGHGRVTSTPGGIDCPASGCRHVFAANTSVTLTETEDSSVFAGWGGDCSGSGHSCVLTLDADKRVTAEFLRPTAVPPPPPPPQENRKDEVEDAVKGLKRANIAYNAPTTLHLGDTVEIQLLLSPRQTVEQLKNKLTVIGERLGQEVKFSNRMEAHLTGTHFKVESIGSEVRAVNPATTTAWRWLVEPTRAGRQSLHLTLSALIVVEGLSTPYEIKTFDRELEVNVTWADRASDFFSGNWQWLWAVILAPLGAWLVHNRSRWLWRFRPGPPVPPS